MQVVYPSLFSIRDLVSSTNTVELRAGATPNNQHLLYLEPLDYGNDIVKDSSSGRYGLPLSGNSGWSVSVSRVLKEWRGINLTITVRNVSAQVQDAPFIRMPSGMYHKNWNGSQSSSLSYYRHAINYMNHDSYGMRSKVVDYTTFNNPSLDKIGDPNAIYGVNWFAPCFTIDSYSSSNYQSGQLNNCDMMSVMTDYSYPFNIYGDFDPSTLKAYFVIKGNVNVPSKGVLDRFSPGEERTWNIWIRYEQLYATYTFQNYYQMSPDHNTYNTNLSGTPTYRKIAALRSYEPYFAEYWKKNGEHSSGLDPVNPAITGKSHDSGPRVSGRIYGLNLAGNSISYISNNERKYYIFDISTKQRIKTAPSPGQSYVNPNTVSGWGELLNSTIDILALKNNGYKAVLILNPAGWGNNDSGQNPAFFTNLPGNLRDTLSQIKDWEETNSLRVLFAAENVLEKVNLGNFNNSAIPFNGSLEGVGSHGVFQHDNFDGGLRSSGGLVLFGIAEALSQTLVSSYFEKYRNDYKQTTLASGSREDNKLYSFMVPGYKDRSEFLKASSYSGSGSGWEGGRDWFLDLLTGGMDPWVYCDIEKWHADFGLSQSVDDNYDAYIRKIELDHQAVPVTIGRIVNSTSLFPRKLNWKEKFETYTSIAGGEVCRIGDAVITPPGSPIVKVCSALQCHNAYAPNYPSSLNFNMIGLYQSTLLVDRRTDPLGQYNRFRSYSWIPLLGQHGEIENKSGECLAWLFDDDSTNPNSKLSFALQTIEDNIVGNYAGGVDGKGPLIPSGYVGDIWINWEPAIIKAHSVDNPPRVSAGGFATCRRSDNGVVNNRYLAYNPSGSGTVYSNIDFPYDNLEEIGVSIGDSLVMYYKNQVRSCNPSRPLTPSDTNNFYNFDPLKIRSLSKVSKTVNGVTKEVSDYSKAKTLREWWIDAVAAQDPNWHQGDLGMAALSPSTLALADIYDTATGLTVSNRSSVIAAKNAVLASEANRDIILQRKWADQWTKWMKAIQRKIKTVRPGVGKITLYGSVPQIGVWAIDGQDFGLTNPENPNPDRDLEWEYWAEWTKSLEIIGPSLYLWDPVYDYDAPYLYASIYGYNPVFSNDVSDRSPYPNPKVRKQKDSIQNRLFQILSIRNYQDTARKAGNLFVPFQWNRHLRDEANFVNHNIMEFIYKGLYTSGANGVIWWDFIGSGTGSQIHNTAFASMKEVNDYWYPVTRYIEEKHIAYNTPRNPPPPLNNQIPIANAGPDDTIQIQDNTGRISYTLNGSESYDPEQDILSYQWTKDSTSLLINGSTLNSINPSFSLIAGTHTFTLVVTDIRGGVSVSDEVVITVNPKDNLAPIPVPGVGQRVAISDYTGFVTVTLDGSGSYDPDGTITSYVWSEIINGVNTVLNTTPVPNQTGKATYPFSSGQHTVILTVTDDGDDLGNNVISASGTVLIDVIPKRNIAPTSNAGPDQNVTIADDSGHISVYLDGSGSHDNEDFGYNGSLSYSWVLNGTEISIQQNPVVSLPAGIHSIVLTVTDDGDFSRASNTRLTSSDVVIITVNPKFNIAPIANAGPDEAKTVSNYSGSMNYTLDGSGSYDPDGSITLYKWTEMIGGNVVTLIQSTSSTSVVSLSVGTHIITLTVTDNGDYSGIKKSNSDTVVITINPTPNLRPVSDPGDPQTVTDTDGDGLVTVTLDGSGSYDSNPGGSIVSYLWKEGPTTLGTSSILSVPLSVGTHTLTLTVTDNGDFYGLANLSNSSDVYITVLAKQLRSPIANAGPDQFVEDSQDVLIVSVQLDGSGTYDPDNNVSSYVWKEGITTIGNGISPSVLLSIGTHTIVLTVTGNDAVVTTDTVVIVVEPKGEVVPDPNISPIAIAGNNQLSVFDLDGSGSEVVALDGSLSYDTDGVVSNFHWTEVILGTRTTLYSGPDSVVNYSFSVGTHVVTLVVTDDDGALSQGSDVIITVNPKPNNPPLADAGDDQSITDTDGSGLETVSLDGSNSSDSDGSISSYSWKLDEVEIATGSNPSVSLPVGQNIIVLTVTDDGGLVDSDSVVINILPKVNTPPIADAGLDQFSLVDADGDGFVTVTLDGSGSSDSDGTIIQYIWSEDGQVLDTLSTSNPAISTYNFAVGVHHVTLSVVDNNGSLDSDFVYIYVFPRINNPPHADAGLDQLDSIVDTDGGGGEFVTLDGSGSNDDDDYPYGFIENYNWVNENVSIATGVNPTSYIEVGQHTIILTVTDNGGLTASDSVIISVSPKENEIPVADAGGNQTVTDTDGDGFVTVTLDGSGSYDPDGTDVSYVWMENGETISTSSRPSFRFSVGLHIVILIVTDSVGASHSDYIFINVNPKPSEPTPGIPGTGGGTIVGKSQNFIARIGKTSVSSLGGNGKRDLIEGFGYERYTNAPSGSVGDSFPEDYSNNIVVAIANSVDGTIEMSDPLSKYSKLEADIINPSFKNVGMPHWVIEDTMEWVNSGMPSHLSQVHHSNIISSGISSERISPGTQDSVAPPFQAKYIVPCNSEWYDKLNSTIDYNLSLDSGNVDLSIPYANCILSIPELNSVLVGGFGGVISIDYTTKDITEFSVDSNRNLLIKDMRKYENTIYILDQSKLYFYDIISGKISIDTSVGLPGSLNSIISIFGNNLSIGAEDGIYARKSTSSSWLKVVSTEEPVNVMSSPDAALAVSDSGECYYSTDGFNWNNVGVISNKIVNKITKHRSQVFFATTNGLYQDGGSFYTKNISLQLLDILDDIESSSVASVNDIDSNFNKAVIGLSDGRYLVYTDDFTSYSDSKLSNIHKVLILENDIWLFSYNKFRVVSESFVRKLATGTKI